jgi:hypothetical protein
LDAFSAVNERLPDETDDILSVNISSRLSVTVN